MYVGEGRLFDAVSPLCFCGKVKGHANAFCISVSALYRNLARVCFIILVRLCV